MIIDSLQFKSPIRFLHPSSYPPWLWTPCLQCNSSKLSCVSSSKSSVFALSSSAKRSSSLLNFPEVLVKHKKAPVKHIVSSCESLIFWRIYWIAKSTFLNDKEEQLSIMVFLRSSIVMVILKLSSFCLLVLFDQWNFWWKENDPKRF